MDCRTLNRGLGLTGLYTAAHFCLDLATVNLVLSGLMSASGGPRWYMAAIIVYNFIAFAGQLPLGIVADALDRDRLLAQIGLLLAAVAYLLRPLPACCVSALGNALFHLGGGREVLRMAGSRAALPGIFVSSGALGLWLAYRLAGALSLLWLPLALLVLAGLIQLWPRCEFSSLPPIRAAAVRPQAVAAAVCLLLTVALRSYLGQIMDFSWKSGTLSLLLVLAVVLGKALGGLLADRWGWEKLTGGSLLLAAVLFLGSFRFAAAGIAAVLLFNMTMPVTLTAMSRLLPGRPGLAFGSTTLALFVGFVPVIANKTALFSPWGLFAGAALSALLAVRGLHFLADCRRQDDD